MRTPPPPKRGDGAFFHVLGWGDFGCFGMMRGNRGLVSPRLLVVGYHLVDWGGDYDKRFLRPSKQGLGTAERGFVIGRLVCTTAKKTGLGTGASLRGFWGGERDAKPHAAAVVFLVVGIVGLIPHTTDDEGEPMMGAMTRRGLS